jgi:hypothetical protein
MMVIDSEFDLSEEIIMSATSFVVHRLERLVVPSRLENLIRPEWRDLVSEEFEYALNSNQHALEALVDIARSCAVSHSTISRLA